MKTMAPGLGLVLLLSGCATIFSGTSQQVNISTSPVEAHLVVKYGPRVLYDGASPWSGRVKKKLSVTVEATAPGYQSQFIEMPRRVTGWYRLNYALLGLFTWIDKATGAAWVLLKPTLHITMAEKEPAPPDIAGTDEKTPPDAGGEKPPPTPGAVTLTAEDAVTEDDYDG